ncbi:hypothetical protein GGQ57_003838 [Parabacteroides faecis]|uniref:Transposase n=1 Tax=Parabacteroides faecis TaxID=1217282 RepID=A0ABR6KR91_9BACT|nr:hypothetical protein [Parabacteroides faecis]
MKHLHTLYQTKTSLNKTYTKYDKIYTLMRTYRKLLKRKIK